MKKVFLALLLIFPTACNPNFPDPVDNLDDWLESFKEMDTDVRFESLSLGEKVEAHIRYKGYDIITEGPEPLLRLKFEYTQLSKGHSEVAPPVPESIVVIPSKRKRYSQRLSRGKTSPEQWRDYATKPVKHNTAVNTHIFYTRGEVTKMMKQNLTIVFSR